MIPAPFDRLPRSALKPFALSAGETLFRKDDRCRGLFYLEAGDIRLIRWRADGHETVIHAAREGETFAEAAVFSSRYHCDAVASRTSCGISIAKEAVLAAMEGDTRFARELAARFAREVQAIRRTVEIICIRSARDRVHAALDKLADSATGVVDVAGPLKEIAARIGLTHEAFYRAVAELAADGLLTRQGRGHIRMTSRSRPATSC